MTKVLRTTGLILGAIVLAVIVAGVVIMTFISANTFKPIISAQVLKYTGRQLTIDGDLSWTIYPFVGFNVGHMTLNNPAGFEEKVFAEVNHATVGVKLIPLMHGKIATDGLSLSGLKLFLIKNSDGTSNWQDLQRLNEANNIAANNTAQTASHDNTMSVEIPSIDIDDAQINWKDKQTNQIANMAHFDLHAKDIYPNRFFPVKATFDFASQGVISGHAIVNGDFKLELAQQNVTVNNLTLSVNMQDRDKKITADIGGNVLAELGQQIVTVKQFTGHITNSKGVKQPLDIKGDIVANLNSQSLKLNNFVGQLANLTLAGAVTINQFSTAPEISGHLQTQPFDLKKFLQTTDQDIPALQTAKMLTADLNFTMAPNQTATPLSSLVLQGQIKLDELNFAKLAASNLNIMINMKDGVVELAPINAALYQGSLQGDAKINIIPATPQISLQAKLAGVQAEPLLRDLEKQGNKMTIKGVGDINLQITTAGIDNDALTRNLNGSVNFAFKNGQLDGVNLGYLLDSAYALVKRQAAPTQGQDVTNFGDLSGSGTIHDGVITNKDFLLDSPRLTAKGEGTIDLNSQKINFVVKANTKDIAANHNDKDALNLYSLAIPVSITGDLNNPNIRINAQSILQEVAEQQMQKIQNKVGDKINDQLKNKLPGSAGDILQNILGH
jgi:AsmA protein